MSGLVFPLVLLAAFLSAAWNAIAKGGGDTRFSTVQITGCAGLLSAACLPFLPAPAPASWPCIAASVTLSLVYYALLAHLYRVADLGRAYPLMRGSAVLLVALASRTLRGEPVNGFGWAGVGLLGAGIAGLAGCALSQVGNVGPDLGQGYIVDSFMVVVLGGVGQLAGTVYAALGLGVLNKLLEGWAGAVLAKIMVLVFIVIFIQKRPQGIFAMKGRSAEA